MQSETQQLVFMDIDPIGGVPEHSHSAQFGVVLEGEMTFQVPPGGAEPAVATADR